MLTACAGKPLRLWLNAPGWSRAQLMGNTRSADAAPITVDDEGRVYLFLVSTEEGPSYPHVIALDRRVNPIWDRTYREIEVASSQKPRILWDGEGLQLFWIASQQLYNVQLDATGRLLSPAVLLSGETTEVADYDVVHDAGGAVTVWYAGSRQEPGVYALPPGDLTGEATLVDAEGVRPDLQYDDAGTLHAIWAHLPGGSGDKPFFYATYPDGRYQPGRETVVVAPRASGTTVVEGPHLGFAQQRAYIFWSMTYYSGLQAGEAETFYVSLPHGEPASVSADRRLSVPYVYDLPYQTVQDGDLDAGPRVPLGPGFRGGGGFITEVTTDPASEQELVIAFHARLAYLMRQEVPQIGAAFFRDGAPIAYQLLSFTQANSTDPTILSDEEGQLYLTWLERAEGSGFSVYFASTAPDIKAALESITPDDAGRLAAEAAFGLLSGALMIPFVLAWMVAPLVILVLTSRIRGEDGHFTEAGTLLTLILALIAYWGAKLISLPQILDYVPFSAWIPTLPASLDVPLQIGVPVLFSVLGLLAAWAFTYRRGENRSAYVFMITYAGVDGVLTTAIYGVVIYGAF